MTLYTTVNNVITPNRKIQQRQSQLQVWRTLASIDYREVNHMCLT